MPPEPKRRTETTAATHEPTPTVQTEGPDVLPPFVSAQILKLRDEAKAIDRERTENVESLQKLNDRNVAIQSRLAEIIRKIDEYLWQGKRPF